jgi:YacP-like NYN domain
VHWFVDGNNVMGAGADGWWNDPVAAAERLTQAIAEWVRGHDDPVTVVFDGRPDRRLSDLAGGTLAVEFATRRGRNAADDRIVGLVEEAFAAEPALRVVTSDKGLVARLPPGVAVEGAGAFRTRLGLAESASRGRPRRRR